MARYKEILKVPIQEKRNLVISEVEGSDRIAIAQQLIVEEGSREISVFLKGAIFIDADKIVEVNKALSEAIYKINAEKLENL